MEQFKIDLLKFAAKNDVACDLMWNEDLEFSVICNDTFAYCSADAEDISSQEDLDLLMRCMEDCVEADGTHGSAYASILYVARKRKMRPLYEVLSHIPVGICDLLEACGSARRNIFDELKEGIGNLEKQRLKKDLDVLGESK